MFVCICNQISDKQIKAAVNEGTTHVRELYQQMGLGDTCGKCVCEARDLLQSELAARNTAEVEFYEPAVA